MGAFYRYANSKFSSKSAIGALQNSNETITNDSSIQAELLQSVFTNKFTLDIGNILSTNDLKVDSKLEHSLNYC